MSLARDSVCRNPDCPWSEEKRKIHWPKAGPGMHIEGTLVCACGWYLELLPDPPTVQIVR